MSRLARKPIVLPESVSVSEEGGVVTVKGAKGEQQVTVLPGVRMESKAHQLVVTGEGVSKRTKANAGTTWSLLANAVKGVTEGFSKKLEIEGVGYRAALEGDTLVLYLGYSHPIRFDVPEDITLAVEKNTITVSGVNKESVGQAAARIRSFRKPEPYKGKGIRYAGEVIRRKVGKKAAGVA